MSVTAAPADITRPATSTASATLAAASSSRRGAVFVNESSAVLYVKFGATASATSYTYAVPAGMTLELPQPVYPGLVTGILAAGTGVCQTTLY